MSEKPVVSVLIPVYNGERFLTPAVSSILGQTFGNLELLVVNDGSTDESGAISQRFSHADNRVRVFAREHAGLVATLNFGLGQARGQYLARLDADDIAMPQRLEKQVAFMEAQPGITISGSAYEVMSEQGDRLSVAQMPEHDTEIRWHVLFHSPFVHSSVIFRLDMLRKHKLHYDPAALHVEDYDLWSRLLEYGQGANLAEPLMRWRVHGQQVSQTGKPEQWANANLVAQRNLAKLGIDLPIEQVSELRRWYYNFPKAFGALDALLCQGLIQSLNTFSNQPRLDRRELNRIRGRWLLKAFCTPCAPAVTCSWKRSLWTYLSPSDLWAVPSYLVYRRKLLRALRDDNFNRSG